MLSSVRQFLDLFSKLVRVRFVKSKPFLAFEKDPVILRTLESFQVTQTAN
jgi:hypothetical protein